MPKGGKALGVANCRLVNPPHNARVRCAHDEPNIHNNQEDICAFSVGNNNFEIKPSLINMLQSNNYHILPIKDPLDQFYNSDMLCETIKKSMECLKIPLYSDFFHF